MNADMQLQIESANLIHIALMSNINYIQVALARGQFQNSIKTKQTCVQSEALNTRLADHNLLFRASAYLQRKNVRDVNISFYRNKHFCCFKHFVLMCFYNNHNNIKFCYYSCR